MWSCFHPTWDSTSHWSNHSHFQYSSCQTINNQPLLGVIGRLAASGYSLPFLFGVALSCSSASVLVRTVVIALIQRFSSLFGSVLLPCSSTEQRCAIQLSLSLSVTAYAYGFGYSLRFRFSLFDNLSLLTYSCMLVRLISSFATIASLSSLDQCRILAPIRLNVLRNP